MTSLVSLRWLAFRLLAALALPALFLVIYLLVIRPTQLRWGSTTNEVGRAIPGDDLVLNPTFLATRGITIQGTPQEIWPWLVQMGYERAGFYGYDLIENLGSKTGIRSATVIIPALQDPKTGDVLPISAVAQLKFGTIQPDRYLIWQSETAPRDGAFTWALYPIDAQHTRLISRIRLHYHRAGAGLALDLFTEFADHVAVPKILQGVKDRVEGRAPETLGMEAVEIAVWLLSLAEFVVAIWLIFRQRQWWPAWLLALGAGLLLLFALYAHVLVWIGAVLASLICAIMIHILRSGSRCLLNDPLR